MASGIITNYHYDNDEFYITKEIDEIIFFKDESDTRRELNSWSISGDGTDLLISLFRKKGDTLPDEVGYKTDKIKIGANFSLEGDDARFEGVIVYGDIGQKIKWSGTQL